MRTAVHIDFAPDVRGPLENHDDALLLRQLKDLHGIGSRHQARSARREAEAFRVVVREVLRVVVVDRRRPRLERHEWLGRSTASTAPSTAAFAATDGGLGSATSARGRGTFLDQRERLTGRRVDDPGAHVRDVRCVPVALFTGHATQVHRAVRQFGSWQRSRRVGPSTLCAGCR